MAKVPPTLQPPAPDRLFVWPCGCVTQDSRTGPLIQDCLEDPERPGRRERDCYRRSAPRVRRLPFTPPPRVL